MKLNEYIMVEGGDAASIRTHSMLLYKPMNFLDGALEVVEFPGFEIMRSLYFNVEIQPVCC
jgi:hypothetical protein